MYIWYKIVVFIHLYIFVKSISFPFMTIEITLRGEKWLPRAPKEKKRLWMHNPGQTGVLMPVAGIDHAMIMEMTDYATNNCFFL